MSAGAVGLGSAARWSALSQGVRLGGQLLSLFLLARLLATSDFGLASIAMVFSGFALYSEGKGLGTWTDLLFGWIIPLVGGSQALHTLHHLGLWVLVLFAMAHIYAVIRDDIMSRQSQVSSIISGYRINKDRP